MLKIYAIKDELNGFTPPLPLPNNEIAKRYLKDQYNENPTIKNSPKDFSLWYIGEFDTELGRMIPNEKKLIERAENYGATEN